MMDLGDTAAADAERLAQQEEAESAAAEGEADADGHLGQETLPPDAATPPTIDDVARSLPAIVQPVELSIVPPAEEMRALVQLANTLAAASLVPYALREKPNDVLLVLLTARDLGVKLTTALRLCHPIEGQVTVAPKLKLAIIRERQIARVWPEPSNDAHSATWHAIRADDPETQFSSTYTWENAQRAGMVRKDCLPEQHHEDCEKNQNDKQKKNKCKSNWFTYPERMLSWRSLGYLMDDACGEVGAGLYSPDELGAVTDEDGALIIDVAEVGVHEGMRSPRGQRQQGGGGQARTPDETDASDETKGKVTWLLKHLPEAAGETMVQLWKDRGLGKVQNLTAQRGTVALALAESVWKRAERGEWEGWTAPEIPSAFLLDGTPADTAAPPDTDQPPGTSGDIGTGPDPGAREGDDPGPDEPPPSDPPQPPDQPLPPSDGAGAVETPADQPAATQRPALIESVQAWLDGDPALGDWPECVVLDDVVQWVTAIPMDRVDDEIDAANIVVEVPLGVDSPNEQTRRRALAQEAAKRQGLL